MKDKEWLKDKIKDEEYNLKYVYNNFVPYEKVLIADDVYDLIKQLDEPEKVVIPKFVADYIEFNKGWSEDRQEYIEDDSSGLWFALDGNSYGMPNSVSDWLFNEEKVETFAKAWLDGYEVEKEKRYRVVFPFTVWDGYASEMKESTMFLALDITSGETRFSRPFPSAGKNGDYRTYLTESQIKAIDERYWAFAEEVTE